MNRRRWAAILIVAGIAFGIVLSWMRISGHKTASGGLSGNEKTNSGPVSAVASAGQTSPSGVTHGGGMAGATVFSNATTAAAEADRFHHHAELVKMRAAVWDYQQRMRSVGVPADTQDLFDDWAMILYRDSLRVGMARLPAADPAAAELLAALRADTAPQIDMIQKANLGPVPEGRTTNLLVQVAALTGSPGLPEAQWMAAEFAYLFSKAKQRSDSFYMSEMKAMLNSLAPIAEKIALVAPFAEIGDRTLAEYPQEYFEGLLQDPGLDVSDRVNVQGLLDAIRQSRTP